MPALARTPDDVRLPLASVSIPLSAIAATGIVGGVEIPSEWASEDFCYVTIDKCFEETWKTDWADCWIVFDEDGRVRPLLVSVGCGDRSPS